MSLDEELERRLVIWPRRAWLEYVRERRRLEEHEELELASELELDEEPERD